MHVSVVFGIVIEAAVFKWNFILVTGLNQINPIKNKLLKILL